MEKSYWDWLPCELQDYIFKLSQLHTIDQNITKSLISYTQWNTKGARSIEKGVNRGHYTYIMDIDIPNDLRRNILEVTIDTIYSEYIRKALVIGPNGRILKYSLIKLSKEESVDYLIKNHCTDEELKKVKYMDDDEILEELYGSTSSETFHNQVYIIKTKVPQKIMEHNGKIKLKYWLHTHQCKICFDCNCNICLKNRALKEHIIKTRWFYSFVVDVP